MINIRWTVQQTVQQKDNRRYTNKNDKNDKNDKNVDTSYLANQDLQNDPVNKILNLFYEYNPGINYGNRTQRLAVQWLLNRGDFEQVSAFVQAVLGIQGEQYAPTVTTPLQLKNKFGDIKVFFSREATNQIVTKIR